MKPARVILAVVAAVSLLAVLVGSLLADAPRRPRPAGWRAPWDALPLLKEGEWAVDPVKRGLVQGEFFLATDELGQCVRRHGGAEGEVLELELLVEAEHGGTHFEYVDAAPRTDLPAGLVSCVTRALEAVEPLPTPGLPDGTLWRLQLNFLVPPLADIPPVPWWKRFLPEGWRSGRSSGTHVG